MTTLPPGYTPMLAAGVVAVRTPNGSLVASVKAAWDHYEARKESP